MQLIHETDSLLRKAGYRTERDLGDASLLYFENENILGFVRAFDTIREVLDGWQSGQDAYLRRSAASLRRDASKARNVYSVALSAAQATEYELSELIGVEENFAATRKIARAGITSRGDLGRAMAPILPLAVVKEAGDANPELTLRNRLEIDERALFDLMRGNADEARMVSWLMERTG
jgi:hypothetical protein